MFRNWPTRDLLANRAMATPEATAVVDTNHERAWTYEALDAIVDDVAARVETMAGPGPVAAILPPRFATVTVLHAAHRVGRPFAPILPSWPADRVASQFERLEPGIVVCAAGTESAVLDAVGAVDSGPPVATVDAPTADGVETLQPVDGGTAGGPEADPLAPDEDALLVFTSGTTGDPKAVRLTLSNLLSSAVASAFRLGVSPDDRWLCCLPMAHLGGLAPVLRSTLYGTAIVVQSGFDGGATAEVMATHDVTGASFVPTQLRRLLDAGWNPPASLRFVLLGGGPAGPALLQEALDAGVPVYPTYGTTETASQVATATPAAVADNPETVGHPLITTDVTVVDDGEPVEAGTAGEIVVAGPTVSPGYLDEAATADAFGPEGFHTGDLGVLDEDGRLTVVGRLDDRITTGGETVQPAVVRGAIEAHPDVESAAVVGVPDPEWGERVVALVVAEALPVEDLPGFLADRLADHEAPADIEFAEALPRTASGTVDREAVRARFETPE